MENNWKFKTLENLEKEYWPSPDPNNGSYLINTCHALRKKPVGEFNTEDLRIMIGQGIGLKYLIPLAIEVLKKDLLAEGDIGFLLKSVLETEPLFWKEHTRYWKEISTLIEPNKPELIKEKFNFTMFEQALYDNGKK